MINLYHYLYDLCKHIQILNGGKMAVKVSLKDNTDGKKKKLDVKDLTFTFLNRVSDEGQLNNKSLDVQKKQMIESTKKLGATFNERFLISGQAHATKGFVRRDLDLVKKNVRAGCNALMVASLDRVGRDSVEFQIFIKFLKENNVRLFVLHEEQDLEEYQSKFLVDIMGAVAEMISEQTKEKAYNSMLMNVEKGGSSGGQLPIPFIHDENGKVVIDPKKKELYHAIRRYHNEGHTREEVIKKFANDGLTYAKLHRLLNHDLYWKGYFTKHFKKRGHDKTATITFKPLITKQEHEETQSIIRRRKGSQSPSNEYLLSRKLQCSCGKWLCGNTVKVRGKVYRYYECRQDKQNGGCGFRVNADTLEKHFLESLEEIITDPYKFAKSIGKDNKKSELCEELRTEKAILSRVQKEIKMQEQKILKVNSDRLIKKVEQRYNELSEQEVGIKHNIEVLQNQIEELKTSDSRIKIIEHNLKSLKGLSGFSFKEKRNFINLIFPSTASKFRKNCVTVSKRGDKIKIKIQGLFTDTIHKSYLVKGNSLVSDSLRSM